MSGLKARPFVKLLSQRAKGLAQPQLSPFAQPVGLRGFDTVVR